MTESLDISTQYVLPDDLPPDSCCLHQFRSPLTLICQLQITNISLIRLLFHKLTSSANDRTSPRRLDRRDSNHGRRPYL
jgi:hypothetical protein